MIPREQGSATYRFHTDYSRPRPTQRSISGPSPLSIATFAPDHPSPMSGYDSTDSNRAQALKSGEGGVSGGGSHDGERDSHDLSITNGGRVRDSLLDNLLLSFDKIGDGTFGNFDTSPFFSNIDEVDDNDSVYSRRGRANSDAYNSQFSSTLSRQLESAHDFGEGSFGVSYDRETRSRGRGGGGSGGGRGLNSSHGYGNEYEPFESAPAPSIRTRNRTPSPPRSPRLVRRLSNKSIKSLRNRDQQYSQPPEPVALPPLPAFANPPPPAAAMGHAGKPNGRPGFFRRVFGGGGGGVGGGGGGGGVGGGSSSSSTINTSQSVKSNPAASAALTNPPSPYTPEPPHSVITKKASFFRRRKKSVSDGNNMPPIPALPIPAPISISGTLPPEVDSPSISLRTAMNPYIRPPPKPATLESTMEDRETAYLARGATIRTVVSSDPISPRRPSFFSDSPRSRETGSHNGSGKKYQKEPWIGTGAIEENTPSKLPKDTADRPQTSPHSPFNSQTFFLDKDDDERDMHWPPSPPTRGILSNARGSANALLGSGKDRQGSVSSLGQGRKSSVVSLNQARKASITSNPIIDIKQLEKQYNEEESRKNPRLGLDISNLEPPKPRDGSWIAGPSPSTPTVTLQKDGPGEEAEILGSDDELDSSTDDGLAELSEEDKETARKIFEGDEEFVTKERAAAWLGDSEPTRATVLKAYMRLFDWSGVNILQAMRIFCGRLILKGETQQVDRIMVAFANRWCECNPNHGFKSLDVVHMVLYSLLLLNTDIHLADIPSSQKMTRSQFIKNTMMTIRRGLQEAAAEEMELRQSQALARSQTSLRNADEDSPTFTTAAALTFPMPTKELKSHKARSSIEFGRDHKGSRLSRIGNIGNLSPRILPDDVDKSDFDADGGLALVNAPVAGGLRLWESQLEGVLKDFYHSVKSSALPLHGSSMERIDGPQSSGLGVFGGSGMLRRSPSTISKAPSELSNGGRGRSDNTKLGAKWSSKNRSRQRVYNGSFAGSSRTSLEDRSMWSPSASSTWSKYTLDKTQTSMSVDSLGSAFTHAGDYQQSIGFASALSNAIIREEGASVTSADGEVDLLDGDDALELEGAPWAKEGMLKHKHHLETVDKRAKNRGWTECFAVIQRGYMRLFLFPSKSGKTPHSAGGVVGGGNWTENAEPIGSFLLRQTLASALPPPGYSKARPNVWALSLPSGAVHFFEVGTSEIVREFVTTANYWSARLSKEPLIGGVSNVEYGWGDCLFDVDLSSSPPPSIHNEGAPPHSRASLQMSIRSSIDHGTVRPRLPGDKVHIKDWSPPSQSMVASTLAEKDQLKALENYVASIDMELAKHQELRNAMQLAFSPRHPNHTKAMNNWEKKSSYLLREIIKFRTYIETLHSATLRRDQVGQDRLSWAAAKRDFATAATATEAEDLDITPKPNKMRELHLGEFSPAF